MLQGQRRAAGTADGLHAQLRGGAAGGRAAAATFRGVPVAGAALGAALDAARSWAVSVPSWFPTRYALATIAAITPATITTIRTLDWMAPVRAWVSPASGASWLTGTALRIKLS
ncbi:hypothetical protein Pflav_066160 [Phytohabitans flavus]|uniref:Uncharacterized protein n=1 Tax=Phytohabitans flavus TaxID=1076124 RepID=A0A6F8Y273_9ACTN|nr:hypothetical protein Pflav_066160 [Phytohabitans flavus]